MKHRKSNSDGRYDKNRGQIDNYNFDPTVFNLMNPIYSQKNNFFQSRILYTPKDDYLAYPNTIYYSKGKNPGAEIDAYTNVTLATTLDLDGDKGKISNIERFNNELIAFSIMREHRYQLPKEYLLRLQTVEMWTEKGTYQIP